MERRIRTIIIVAAVVLSTVLVYYAIVPPGKYDSFAKCLTEKGVVMYGADWCTACMAQKAFFGTSFSFVNYTRCSDNEALCTAKGVDHFPTWEINGNLTVGAQQLSTLANLSGCALP